MIYELNFLKALLLTISVETAVMFLLFKLVYKSLNISKLLLIFTGILTTFSTLPYLWFILPLFIQSRVPYIILSELSAVLIESVIILGILRISYRKALFVSLTCNMVSFIIGLLIL